MLTERKMFSRSLVSSAASGVETPHELIAHEPVDRFGALGARVGEAPEDLGGVAQREVGASGVHALGAERQVEVTTGR